MLASLGSVGRIGRMGLSGRAALVGRPSLALDFMQPGTLDNRITFSRASTARYTDVTGTMQTAAINAPRWDYDPVTHALRGLLLEDQRTNGVRNSTMQGAVPGSPGTLPTNWSSAANATALSQQVVGTGTENGITYVDIRLFGTSGAGQYYFFFDTSTGISAATGQVWTYTLYWRVAAGSFNGLSIPQLSVIENTAAGVGVRSTPVGIANPTSASLSSQRPSSGGVTLSGGGTVGMVQPRMIITAAAGATVDATLRFGGIQMEQGDFPTSYIPTTSATVTRSPDVCSMADATWFTSPGGSWFCEFISINPTPAASTRVIAPKGGTGVTPMFINASKLVGQSDGASVLTANALSTGAVTKAATVWASGQAKSCLNGGVVALSASLVTGYTTIAAQGVYFMGAFTVPADSTPGWLRRVVYWPRALSSGELQQATT